MGSAGQYIPICNMLALQTNCVVINCNYRLCPETKFPLPIFDVYSILKNIIELATSIGFDKSKIVLAGESGGSTMCMGLA